MDDGSVTASLASRFEKTPSAEKEEKVLDFTHLDDKFAEDVVEIEQRKPREDDKAISDLPPVAVDKDGTVMQLVSNEYTIALLKSPPRTKPLADYSIESLRAGTGITDEDELEAVAKAGWALQRLRDSHNDIIQQYLDQGYAYIELPDDSEIYPLPAAKQLLPPLP